MFLSIKSLRLAGRQNCQGGFHIDFNMSDGWSMIQRICNVCFPVMTDTSFQKPPLRSLTTHTRKFLSSRGILLLDVKTLGFKQNTVSPKVPTSSWTGICRTPGASFVVKPKGGMASVARPVSTYCHQGQKMGNKEHRTRTGRDTFGPNIADRNITGSTRSPLCLPVPSCRPFAVPSLRLLLADTRAKK